MPLAVQAEVQEGSRLAAQYHPCAGEHRLFPSHVPIRRYPYL
jgi:hypothetical protein